MAGIDRGAARGLPWLGIAAGLACIVGGGCGSPQEPSDVRRATAGLTTGAPSRRPSSARPRTGATAGATVPAAAANPDPIATVAHGGFYDASFRPIAVTPELRRRAQDFYLDRLTREASPAVRSAFAAVERDLRAQQPRLGIDEVTARSFLIAWLIVQVRPPDLAGLYAKNASVRASHLAELYASTRTPVPRNAWGMPDHVVTFGRDRGFLPMSATGNGGLPYREECRLAGVPVPPDWGTSGWTDEGDLTPDFLSITEGVKVFASRSTYPLGLCVALPRFNGDVATAVGIVCLGHQTGNVCYWDGESIPMNEVVPLDEFKGGADLLGGNGVCSVCHAGENPFIVHPGSALDLGGWLKSSKWPNPLVPIEWHVPGPNTLIGQVPIGGGEKSCLGCHNSSGIAGRFPEITPEMEDYCKSVLEPALAMTMPNSDSPGDEDYATHINALRWFCGNSPPGGDEVPGDGHDNDTGHLGEPIIGEPLYGCAKKIRVTGATLDAQIRVRISGTLVALTTMAHETEEIDVPKLAPGQVVTATAYLEGLESKEYAVTVKDYKVDFPAGLPKPTIDPMMIYECGRVIAVRHNVPGSVVSVWVNGDEDGAVFTGSTSSGWTNVKPPDSPFSVGHEYRARYQICDESSDPSEPQWAWPAPPGQPPAPLLDQPIVAGQKIVTARNLLNGAFTRITASDVGLVAAFSTAIDWKPDINIEEGLGAPLAEGQELTIESELCAGSPRMMTTVETCASIPAPAIKLPLVGDTVALVTERVPGARIFVFDQDDAELGDGSGDVLVLARALEGGDVLTVRQQVGACLSAQAYQIAVMCYAENQGC
jgi:hypothetical protein